MTSEVGPDHIEVTFKTIDDNDPRWDERLAFGKLWVEPEFGVDALQAYCKAGPMWLYTGNREYVMGMSYGARQQMVMDIEQDDPTSAHEVGRDLLKDQNAAPAPGRWAAAADV